MRVFHLKMPALHLEWFPFKNICPSYQITSNKTFQFILQTKQQLSIRIFFPVQGDVQKQIYRRFATASKTWETAQRRCLDDMRAISHRTKIFRTLKYSACTHARKLNKKFPMRCFILFVMSRWRSWSTIGNWEKLISSTCSNWEVNF